MTRVRAVGLGVLVLAGAPCAGSVAGADTCGPVAGIDLALPVDGSADVDPAAWITVRYSLEDVPPDGAPSVTLRNEGGEEVEVATSWDGREVVLVPAEPLAPDASFVVVAERPSREDHSFGFATGGPAGGPAAPILGPSLAASFEYLGGGPEGDDPCGPIGFERYRVHLELPAATGTSGPENVVYLAFQTRGRGITEPLEVARAVDESGSDDVRIDLYRPANGVSGRACFRVLAVDVTGPPSGTTDEACVFLEEGPFFVSLCSAAGAAIPGSAGEALGVGAGALVLGIALVRRRPRSR